MAKKDIALIIGMGKPKEESSGGGSMKAHKREVAKELCQAIDDKDYDAIAEAFQAMHELCCADEDYEEGDEEEGREEEEEAMDDEGEAAEEEA